MATATEIREAWLVGVEALEADPKMARALPVLAALKAAIMDADDKKLKDGSGGDSIGVTNQRVYAAFMRAFKATAKNLPIDFDHTW